MCTWRQKFHKIYVTGDWSWVNFIFLICDVWIFVCPVSKILFLFISSWVLVRQKLLTFVLVLIPVRQNVTGGRAHPSALMIYRTALFMCTYMVELWTTLRSSVLEVWLAGWCSSPLTVKLLTPSACQKTDAGTLWPIFVARQHAMHAEHDIDSVGLSVCPMAVMSLN